MATVRVYLPTYRRGAMLARAVASLRAQTFTDWVCELHNDCPGDDAPARLLRETNDPRFQLVEHPENLGTVATFNLVFQPVAEPFYSLLEDDNWWEPDFLETMLAAARAFPDAKVFWANMRVWQEEAGDTFRDTGNLIHPYQPGDAPRAIGWGSPVQLWGPLHSNGAGLFRSSGGGYPTPAIPAAMVEAFRERLFVYPLVFVPAPVAHFTLTLKTQRNDSRTGWAMLQTMLVATFLKHARYDRTQLETLWSTARASTPPTTNVLILASFMAPSCRFIRRPARAGDWARWLRSTVRRPSLLIEALRIRRRQAEAWAFLDTHTGAQFSRARAAQPEPVSAA